MNSKFDNYSSSRFNDEKSPKQRESSLNSQNPSIWAAKLQRSKVEKNLDVLKNRINLLSQIEIKAKRKVKDMKEKTEKIIELKKNFENSKVFFSFFNKNGKFLIEKQKIG